MLLIDIEAWPENMIPQERVPCIDKTVTHLELWNISYQMLCAHPPPLTSMRTEATHI